MISCHTAFTYKDRPVGARRVGRELGVRYVLEGSVQRFGNRVRVNAQLIDAETDAHLDSGGLISHTGTAGIGAKLPCAEIKILATRKTTSDIYFRTLGHRELHLGACA